MCGFRVRRRHGSAPGKSALAAALETGAALLASEQLGVAQWCFDTTLAYAKQRKQFGRAIGSYQAIKHRLADLWFEVGSATAAARYAADTCARGDEDAATRRRIAQAYCSGVAVHAAEECVQLHGGIGMTWEYPAHLYLKRAKSDQLAFGTAYRHRARLAELVDLPSSWSPMRVLLSTYDSRGGVEPLLALAVQLQALGAEVMVCAPPDEEFAERVAGLGVPLVRFGEPVRAMITREAPPSEEELRRHVVELIAAQFDMVAAAAEGCDALVATNLLSTRPAHGRWPRNWASTTYTRATTPPTCRRRTTRRRRMRASVPEACVDNRELWDHDARNANADFGPTLNGHRAAIGLPPVDNVRTHAYTEHPWLAADPTLAPWQELADLDVVQTGAWLLPDERPLPAELLDFLDAGTPPVYVGFGSMSLRAGKDIVGMAIEAIRAQGRRVLLAQGWAELALIDDRDDCFLVGEVNQQELFGRVAAVVHHGGAGTTTTAAGAGAPQVVVPQGADQVYWACRVVEMGIGTAYDGRSANSEAFSAAIEAALAPETASGERGGGQDPHRRGDGGRDAAAGRDLARPAGQARPVAKLTAATARGTNAGRREDLGHRRPVPLGGGGVVGRVVRDREAVSGLVPLDGVLHAGCRQRLVELFGVVGRERRVVLGAAHVHRGGHPVGQQVRAVRGVGHQAAAVEGRRGGDAVGKTAGHQHRDSPAHAVAAHAEAVAGHLGASGQVVEERGGVAGDFVRCQAADHREQPVALLFVAEHAGHVERGPVAVAVVHVGQQHRVAESGQLGRHLRRRCRARRRRRGT